MKKEVTFINNIFDSKPEHLHQLSFEDLIQTFSEQNDFAFKRKLKDLGYFKRLYINQMRAERDINNRNWESLKSKPDKLAFKLKGYHRDFILSHQTKSSQFLTESDFQPIAGLPTGFIEDLKITRYQLLKPLYPGFSFAQFQSRQGKKEDFTTNLAPYMALDIDIPFDDEKEMLNKLGKYVDIYCVLTSPNGGLRPVIRIDSSAEMMHQLTKWQQKNVDIQNIKWHLPALWKTYLHIVFDKIQRSLNNETVQVNGVPAPFVLDNKCKNLNRFWYISRLKGRSININSNAEPVKVTRDDCIEFSKKIFPATNCIFGSLA
tara:strand:+ start:855 stop:1808 length:954 start_codon:yes stop_codon:yes gene_type:complete